MKLRVPDYYSEFSCIADKCKDSCCIGWEIDIDEDTHEYYNFVEGEFGDRLRENMYMTEDGDHSFKLKKLVLAHEIEHCHVLRNYKVRFRGLRLIQLCCTVVEVPC